MTQVKFDRKLNGKNVMLGVQHVFAMFGATVLVPALTGMSPAVALFCAGLGTLLYHFVTGGKVPTFLGSSFAFIVAIQGVCAANGGVEGGGLAYATGGIIVAGAIYLLLALFVKFFGVDRVRSFFPPVVTGCMIIIIGLMLAPTAISSITSGVKIADAPAVVAEVPSEARAKLDEALGEYEAALGLPEGELAVRSSVESEEARLTSPSGVYAPLWKNWLVAALTMAVIIGVSLFAKGFFKLVPILFGIVGGYLIALALGLVDFTPIREASFFAAPEFFLPKFSWSAILMLAPVGIVTFVEHIGDVTAASAVTGKDYMKDPGLHRTLIGDGLATMLAGCIGGPANTTYSENTGVLAATRNYNPFTLEIAAVFAVVISFVGKLGGALKSIPGPVLGGVSVVLFGMITAVGLRNLVENKVDFSKTRNLLIAAVMLVLGLGGVSIPVGEYAISGTALAALLGIILNKVLPKEIEA